MASKKLGGWFDAIKATTIKGAPALTVPNRCQEDRRESRRLEVCRQ